MQPDHDADDSFTIGYTDELGYAPGATLTAFVSSTARQLTPRLVRLINGDEHPRGPGRDVRHVPSALDGQVLAGQVQPLRPGSCVSVERSPLGAGTTVLRLWLRPTALGVGHRQVVVSFDGADGELAWLEISSDDRWTLGSATGVDVGPSVVQDVWFEVTIELAEGAVACRVEERLVPPVKLGVPVAARPAEVGLVFAARRADGETFTDFLNGRIESPTLHDAAAEQVARWDFGPSATPRQVCNLAGAAFEGRSHQYPLRACLGHAGASHVTDPSLDPDSYQAIGFHEDDLDDAGWEPVVELTLPDDLLSGVYGIELVGDDQTQDTLPFVVTPPRPTADVLLVLPTFSYLAYSCEHVMADPASTAYMHSVGVDDVPEFGGNRHDSYLLGEGLRSLYDVHVDGSGHCFTSWRKPLPNVRHDHRWAAVAGDPTSAHQFSADLHVVAWLTGAGYDFDVATDLDVHTRGPELLGGYRVVLTGTHPEYPTAAMHDAYAGYLEDGGRLMYLGGNGFYWVTSIDPEEQHTIEIRRTAGIRAWEPAPGEWHHLTTGELGGLWRARGKAPQALVGVGMAAQGFDDNRPYDVVVDTADPRWSFVFDGLELPGGQLGSFGSLVNDTGAAGVEVDRADPALGTSRHAIVLATASGFGRAYGLDPVDVRLPDGRYDGTNNPMVRADMVLVPTPRQGAVFATGSIAFGGSLLVEGGDNDVSRLAGNVLDAFLRSEQLPFHPESR